MSLLKQSLIYLLLSVIVILFTTYAHMLIIYVDMLYTYINLKLIPLFDHSYTTTVIRKLILLVLIPLAMAAIPALIYRLIQGKNFPHFVALTWGIWLVVVLSNILIR